ncbi:MAG: radical SAM protein [Prevotella sp.]|nr:radical SAM protein [Prevotella sp.]
MKLSSFVHFASFGVKTILFRKKEPILGTVIVTDKCNLECKHCSVNNITAVVHPYEKVRKELQTLYDLGVRILFFCGGETFLWRDGEKTLRNLVVEAKEMGFLIVNVVTNGTFPIDLPEADLILLSLDGDRERHNTIRGNTYDTILENIRNATASNICFYIEHTPEGGTITITALKTALYTQIEIEDTGAGFDAKDIPHLFERFYKGSNASETSYGIGLALARTVITAQNGTVQAANGSTGAKFVIKFYKQVLSIKCPR